MRRRRAQDRTSARVRWYTGSSLRNGDPAIEDRDRRLAALSRGHRAGDINLGHRPDIDPQIRRFTWLLDSPVVLTPEREFLYEYLAGWHVLAEMEAQ